MEGTPDILKKLVVSVATNYHFVGACPFHGDARGSG